MTDMVDVEILRRVDGIEPTRFDEVNRDITGYIQSESMDEGQVNDLMRGIAADQVSEASDALEKVAADGGIEAHAMKGDPSKCPFLMGKIGVGQHVEVGEIRPTPEGRSVKEIREERRRLRAQAKEVQSESVVPSPVKDVIVQEKVGNFQPRLEHIIRQAHAEAVPTPQPFERKKVTITDAPASSLKHPAVKSEIQAVNIGLVKDRIIESSGGFNIAKTESKNPRVITEPVIKPRSAENIGVKPTLEVSPVQLVREQKRTFTESLGAASRIVDAPKKVSSIHQELLVPGPRVAIEHSGNTPISTEAVTYFNRNVSHNPSFDRELTTAVVTLEHQARPENLTSLTELMTPYLADGAIEKAAVLEIVQVLSEKISDLIDTDSLNPDKAEITATIERLMQKFPEQLRTELRTIVGEKVQEMIAGVETYGDQRETFNILGTHEFKFFHHKPHAKLPIKEKASRYLLTLISKDYALA